MRSRSFVRAFFGVAALALVACDGDEVPSPMSDASGDGGRSAGAGPDAGADVGSDGGHEPAAAPALATGRFRIGLWCGIPASQLTPANFAVLAAAGFTTHNWPCEGPRDTPEYNLPMLALAHDAGLDSIVWDTRTQAALAGTDVDGNLGSVVAQYAGQPALAGYFVQDEPSASAFAQVARVVSGLAKRDPEHFGYVNLLPAYGDFALGVPTYDEYVSDFLTLVKPSVFSFDNYPFISDGTDELGILTDLETVRAHSLATHTPFWQYIQSFAFDNRRQPTRDEMLWEGTQTLAYGGAGVSYFLYWSVIADSHGPTALYPGVQYDNARLAAYGRYLVPAQSTAVFQNGELPAAGTRPREPGMPVYLPSAAPVTVGLFTATDGILAFLANRDHDRTTDTDVYLATTARAPEALDVTTGQFVPLKATIDATGTKVHVSIAPGDGTLIHLPGPVPAGAPGAEVMVGTVRQNAGTLYQLDSHFGSVRLRTAAWNECPAGYAFAGRDLQSDGFWLCVRSDLTSRTFLVGNVVSNAGRLYAVQNGSITDLGPASWNACNGATDLGGRLDPNGFWVCLE